MTAPATPPPGDARDYDKAWLIERVGTTPEYVAGIAPNKFSYDPWSAKRYSSEAEAWDAWRSMGHHHLLNQFKPIEHIFYRDVRPSPTADEARSPRKQLLAIADLRERFEAWMASSNYPEIADVAIEKLPDGQYKSQLTFAAYETWKFCHQLLSTIPGEEATEEDIAKALNSPSSVTDNTRSWAKVLERLAIAGLRITRAPKAESTSSEAHAARFSTDEPPLVRVSSEQK